MIVTVVGFAGADFKFSMHAPSTVAAACIRLAVAGVFGDSWCSRHHLDRRLRRITQTDPVNTLPSLLLLILRGAPIVSRMPTVSVLRCQY